MKKIWRTFCSLVHTNNRVKMNNVFTSDEQKAYKEKQNIWVLTTILCTLFPFITQMLSGFFNHSFAFKSIINGGDVILLLYSITIPVFIELLQTNHINHNFDHIKKCIIFTLLILTQMAVFSNIKSNTYSNDTISETLISDDLTPDQMISNDFIRNLVFTLLIIISSALICNNTMKFIFICNVELKRKEEVRKNAEEIDE